MNKPALKNFAISARLELLARVRDRAAFYGITEEKYRDKAIVPTEGFQRLDGVMLSSREAQQRNDLLARIRGKGYEQVMEEAAYTWFNRFIALRYMEEHRLLPMDARVLPEQPGLLPQLVREAQRVELDGIERAEITAMLEENRTEELYKTLLIALCNQLSTPLPQMFEPIADYTELLFPDGILKAESVLGMLAALNRPGEDNWGDIETIGWLYQYYISEKHDEVVNINGNAVKKDDVPAATCLYTTDWVVKYMVENSLGSLWLEGHDMPALRQKWRYYMTDAEQLPEVAEKLSAIHAKGAMLQPEQITVLDPCMGSGHILAYAFDILMDIYRSVGYTDRDAVQSIIENNLYGLDIDDRAAQLAYFALMMKACEYDWRFLRRGIQPHVCPIEPSQNIFAEDLACFGPLKQQALDLYHTFTDAKEYGSILTVPLTMEELRQLSDACDDLLRQAKTNISFEIAAMQKSCAQAIRALIPQAMILAQKYDAVITNPPYLNKFSVNLKRFVQEHYADYKSDLFSVFMYRNFDFCKENGYTAFMSPFVWMFIKSYEKLRDYILKNKCITTLIQMEYSAFEEATVPICSFVLRNTKMNYTGSYLRLSDFKGGMEVQKQKVLEAQAAVICSYRYTAQQDNFSKIPGAPVAYWVSKELIASYNNPFISDVSRPCKGIDTGDNGIFLRLWFEIEKQKMAAPTSLPLDRQILNQYKWFPYNKGGEYRKWFGNADYLLNYEQDGKSIKAFSGSNLRNKDCYFKRGITWSTVTSGQPSMRYFEYGFLFDNGGSCLFAIDKLFYILGFLNSKVSSTMLNIAPTLNTQPGDIGRLPFVYNYEKENLINSFVNNNITLSRADWNSFETSWDFQRHPLI